MTNTASGHDDRADTADAVENEEAIPEHARIAPADDQTVIVGVDGSAPALAALEWAARYAQAFSLRVRCVSAWTLPVDYGYGMAITEDIDFAGTAKAELSEEVVAVHKRYPDVAFDAIVVNDQAAPALVDVSKGSALLVVGASGHGEIAGILLGSVSTHCVHHASVPVVVVR